MPKKKKREEKNRKRNLTIAFRVSPDENEQINQIVKISGLTKQQYLTDNMLQHSFTVYPTPRVYKALKEYFLAVVEQLKRLETGRPMDDTFWEVLTFALQIYDKMK